MKLKVTCNIDVDSLETSTVMAANLADSALDPSRLSGRARNAIERIWGANVTREDLTAPDAYVKLCATQGVGARTLAEIDAAMRAWGCAGLGGRAMLDDAQLRRLRARAKLWPLFRSLGPREVVLLLAEFCAEQIAKARHRLARPASKSRVARQRASLAFHLACEATLRPAVESLPAQDGSRR